MTNKQRYQRTFSTLHASEDCLMEVKAMKPTKKIYISRLSVACAAVVMAIGLASVVYAADVGGIQRNVQIWIDGDKTDAVLDIQGTSYTVTTAQSPSREIKGGMMTEANVPLPKMKLWSISIHRMWNTRTTALSGSVPAAKK